MEGNVGVNLSGKVLAITGGFGALGQAVARTMAGYGARLALLDHAPAPPTLQPPGTLLYGGIDLAQEEIANSIMERIVREAGRLDGLVNIAGGFRWEKLELGALDS